MEVVVAQLVAKEKEVLHQEVEVPQQVDQVQRQPLDQGQHKGLGQDQQALVAQQVEQQAIILCHANQDAVRVATLANAKRLLL